MTAGWLQAPLCRSFQSAKARLQVAVTLLSAVIWWSWPRTSPGRAERLRFDFFYIHQG